MSLYRWHGTGTQWAPASRIVVGDLIALDHEAWRITSISLGEEQIAFGAVKEGSLDQRPHSMLINRHRGLDVLPEHYSVCVKCGELQPCRDQEAARTSADEAKTAERYELAGICPACQEPVTRRQQSITFTENVMTPLGPPVTFHRRQRCFSAAIRYDQLQAADTKQPPQLEESLTCDGSLYRHRDGTTTCTSIDCPSIRAHHMRWAQCFTRSAGCPRFECQSGIGVTEDAS